MNKNMKALRAYAPFDYRLDEVEVPAVEAGEILMKVSGCGVCASDVKTYHGGIRVWGKTPEERYIDTPTIAGHEYYGEVVEVGEGVDDIKVGDVIVSEQILPCGECRFCKRGDYWMCKPHHIVGFKLDVPGGFAEYSKINRKAVNHILPKDFPVEKGSIIEPYACAMHAVERGNIKHTDVVVISGLGCIGLGMTTVAKKYAPKMIIGLDLRKNRLDKALEFGADYVLNPMECNVVEEIKKLTDGYGCDVYIEASGSEKSVTQGLDAVANLGTYVQFGIFADVIKADWNIIGDTKEIDIHGSHLGAHCYKAVIDGIVDGSIKTDGIVTHKYNLQDWEKAFETAEKDPDAIKVTIVP